MARRRHRRSPGFINIYKKRLANLLKGHEKQALASSQPVWWGSTRMAPTQCTTMIATDLTSPGSHTWSDAWPAGACEKELHLRELKR